MGVFAYFDHTVPSPSPVLGWYDTDSFSYSIIPGNQDLLEITPDQWADRLDNLNGWAVSDGGLVPYVPSLTLAQQAGDAMIRGITITVTGPTLTLAATLFPTDPITQSKLAAVVTAVTATGMFPGGIESFPMKGSQGGSPVWISLNVPQYLTIAGAISTYVAALSLIIDGHPGSTELPASSVSISI
jgi:hypothetical protein